uniref:Uncharacterized protein n=1 Tax=Rousettus aegyptiacus TaxID=9407 RepID=A0A7J8FJ35_ROUAE|nr:hypothetical protein HJG63_011998 [Rousettus aegyptiacus]
MVFTGDKLIETQPPLLQDLPVGCQHHHTLLEALGIRGIFPTLEMRTGPAPGASTAPNFHFLAHQSCVDFLRLSDVLRKTAKAPLPSLVSPGSFIFPALDPFLFHGSSVLVYPF